MKINVPFNDTSRVYREHAGAIAEILAAAGESGQWVSGENVRSFAAEFAAYCGASHCLPVGNGTDALEFALRAVLSDSPAGENEIVTAANAGGYVTAMCRLAGAVPVYADIDEESLLIDIESLKRCLGPKVKAVVVTHLYGGTADIETVRKALRERNCGQIPVIEDCSHAHGAFFGKKRAGSFGDLAVFSFYPTKNLGALGDAGAVVTSNGALFQKVKALSQYGWNEKYRTQIPHGRNSRMDEIQAGALRLFLPGLDAWNLKRKNIYERYKKHAPEGLRPLRHGPADYVAHLAVFRTRDRKRFIDFMRERGAAVEVHYPVLDCDQAAWLAMPMRSDPESGLAASRRAVDETVSLPCFPHMTEDEIAHVCRALAAWNES